MKREIWKQYETYKISNLGNVNSKGIALNSKVILIQEKGKTKQIATHKAIATLFVPNPENYKYVKFRDGNENNRTADNLEWVSFSRAVTQTSKPQSKLEKVRISEKRSGVFSNKTHTYFGQKRNPITVWDKKYDNLDGNRNVKNVTIEQSLQSIQNLKNKRK